MTAPGGHQPCDMGCQPDWHHDECAIYLPLLSDPPIEHGSLTAYTKRGCRCDLCREFWNAYMRWWRADHQGRTHGACPTCTCPLPEKPTTVTPPEVDPS